MLPPVTLTLWIIWWRWKRTSSGWTLNSVDKRRAVSTCAYSPPCICCCLLVKGRTATTIKIWPEFLNISLGHSGRNMRGNAIKRKQSSYTFVSVSTWHTNSLLFLLKYRHDYSKEKNITIYGWLLVTPIYTRTVLVRWNWIQRSCLA